jgi:crossover junction endodeoxyribonuclease RuvC
MMTEKVLVNSPVQVIGVDPGKSGAVVRIGKGCFDVRRDFKDLQSIALAVADLARGCDYGIVENVHAMPGQGVVSMFTFGKATGVAFGALFLALAKTAPLLEVAPLKWQNFFRSEMGVDKSVAFHSPSIASRLFPHYAQPYLQREKDHNTADAILLATWFLLQGPEARQQLMQPPVVEKRKRRKPRAAPVQATPQTIQSLPSSS